MTIQLYYTYRFPFKKNIYEYAFEFAVEYLGGYLIFLGTGTIMAIFIACCLMIMSILKDLRTELALNMSTENSIEIRVKILEFNRLHTYSKRLSYRMIACFTNESENAFNSRWFTKFVNIYQFVFFVYFIWSLMSICVSLLSAQIELVKF